MYKDQMGGNVNGTFHQQYLTALNDLTALCLEKASVQEAVSALWRYVVDFISYILSVCNDEMRGEKRHCIITHLSVSFVA